MRGLDYQKAVAAADDAASAAAGMAQQQALVPLKQVRMRLCAYVCAWSAGPSSCIRSRQHMRSTPPSAAAHRHCTLPHLLLPAHVQLVLDSYKRNRVPLSSALSALLPIADVTCPQLSLVAPLRALWRLDDGGSASSQQQVPGAAVELVARLSMLHASVG